MGPTYTADVRGLYPNPPPTVRPVSDGLVVAGTPIFVASPVFGVTLALLPALAAPLLGRGVVSDDGLAAEAGVALILLMLARGTRVLARGTAADVAVGVSSAASRPCG